MRAVRTYIQITIYLMKLLQKKYQHEDSYIEEIDIQLDRFIS